MQPNHMGFRPPSGPMPRPQGFGNRFPAGRSHQMGGRPGGGLLSRLFNNQAASQQLRTMSPFARAPQAGAGSGSFMQNLMNPQTINSFLNNTQNVLKTAQQVGPIFQQYGPLVRNLPAMWKLYRGFKDSDDKSESTGQNESSEDKTEENKSKNEKEPLDKFLEEESGEKRTQKRKQGVSVPKLYI